MDGTDRTPRRTRSSTLWRADEHISLDYYARRTKRIRTSTVKEEELTTSSHQLVGSEKAVKVNPPDRSTTTSRKRPRKKGDYAHLGSDPLTDRIREGLDVLFCGENPGIRTAEIQLHYASPHNHFYKALHAAGLTPTVLEPSASRTLPEDYNIGITNLIPRPTREASELTKAELEAAVPVMLRKVARYRPRIVTFIGMKVGDTVAQYFAGLTSQSRDKDVKLPPSTHVDRSKKLPPEKLPPVKAAIGLQPYVLEHREGLTYFYVLPSTSGRVAAYPLPVKLKLFETFGQSVAKLRASSSATLEMPSNAIIHQTDKLGLESSLPPEATKNRVERKVKVEELH